MLDLGWLIFVALHKINSNTTQTCLCLPQNPKLYFVRTHAEGLAHGLGQNQAILTAFLRPGRKQLIGCLTDSFITRQMKARANRTQTRKLAVFTVVCHVGQPKIPRNVLSCSIFQLFWDVGVSDCPQARPHEVTCSLCFWTCHTGVGGNSFFVVLCTVHLYYLC